jgi:hypothetical protein
MVYHTLQVWNLTFEKMAFECFVTYWRALLRLHPFGIVHTLLGFSPTHLFKGWSKRFVLKQQQSSTQANWLMLASLLATFRHKWESSSLTILPTLAEMIGCFYVIQSVGDCNCAAGNNLHFFANVYWHWCSEIWVDSQNEFTSSVYQQLLQWHSIEMVTCIVESFVKTCS